MIRSSLVALLALLTMPGWAASSLQERIDEVDRLRGELERTLPRLESRGGGAKTRATVAVMNDFFPWMLKDLSLGFTNRVDRELDELVKIGTDEVSRLKRVAAGIETDDPVPKYANGPVRTSQMQVIGKRRWTDGRTDEGPVFLTGFGHFTTVQNDVAKLPPLGNSIIQIECKPKRVLPAEDLVDVHALDEFLAAAKRAAKANVQVCLLLSPHYFPPWALRKWPYLKECAGSRFGFCIYDPNAKAVIEKYLRTVVPIVRGTPALHSFCLTNEAEDSVYGNCRILKAEWPKWLEARYGTVEAMNEKWRTSYAAFSDVPVLKEYRFNRDVVYAVDFIRFCREMFFGYHKWMADIIHEIDPEIPVHTKIMCNNGFWRSESFYSVDIDDFASLGAYNGNDSLLWQIFEPGEGKWGRYTSEFSLSEMAYDYQRSAAKKPIFNTEDHLIRNREKRYMPGNLIYSALWQQAVHGQAAASQWTWERAYDDGKSEFNGLILERPECLNAWAHCALDLNRLADRLAPIQNLDPTVLIHYSISSRAREEGIDEAYACYRAANWLGQQLGVVSERMLADYAATGVRKYPLASARAILLPVVGYLPDAVRKGLLRLRDEGVAIVAYGKRPLADDYGNSRPDDGFKFVERCDDDTLEKTIAEMAKTWVLPDVPRPMPVAAGEVLRGVESRGYRQDGKSYVTMVNHSPNPVSVRIEKPGVNLITGGKVDSTFELAPARPVFVRY